LYCVVDSYGIVEGFRGEGTMTAEDIKLTVADFAIGKVSKFQVAILQRYFIHEYCSWLPMRAVAEMTGAKCHTTVRDADRAVKSNRKLYNMSLAVRLVLEKKKIFRTVNFNTFRLSDGQKKFLNDISRKRI
jgi:hypothetical protein